MNEAILGISARSWSLKILVWEQHLIEGEETQNNKQKSIYTILYTVMACSHACTRDVSSVRIIAGDRVKIGPISYSYQLYCGHFVLSRTMGSGFKKSSVTAETTRVKPFKQSGRPLPYVGLSLPSWPC